MKTSKRTRLLALALTLVLSFSLCPSALADLDPSDYSDLKEDYWAYDSIMYCSEWEIVKGYDDGKFYPENPVSGVEFVTMITRTFYADEVAAAQAEKSADAPWYWVNIKVADDKFITNGLTASSQNMNRYDMAQTISNTLHDQDKFPSIEERNAIQSSIKDYDSIPQNRQIAVKGCYATGILTGMSDGKFHGEQFMTRAQACVVITRMINVINGETPGVPSTPQQPAQPEAPAQPETTQQAGSGLLANGQPATVENVQAILDQIKQEYPTGTLWSDPNGNSATNYYTDEPGYDNTRDVRAATNKFGSINLKYGCGGWMCMVSERIFGKTGAPAREITDITKARPGDIVIKMNSTGNAMSHVSIFLEYKPGYTAYGVNVKPEIITCDGNMNYQTTGTGTVDWCYPNTLYGGPSDIGTRIHILTRYPD